MSSPSPPQNTDHVEYDPTFLHARKEAIIIFLVWVAALLWTLPYCYFNGYADKVEPENLETIIGIPSWIFWGVAFPWSISVIFSTWFCFFYMVDDDLGEADEGADLAEEIAEMHAAETAKQPGKEADA